MCESLSLMLDFFWQIVHFEEFCQILISQKSFFPLLFQGRVSVSFVILESFG